jgi:hypothetical protein
MPMTEMNDGMQVLKVEKKSARFEKRRQAWEKVRKHGKLRFILFRGVFGYGVLMIIVLACIDKFIDHKVLAVHPIRSSFLILAGWFIGLIGWDAGERRFRDQGKQQHSINEN